MIPNFNDQNELSQILSDYETAISNLDTDLQKLLSINRDDLLKIEPEIGNFFILSEVLLSDITKCK